MPIFSAPFCGSQEAFAAYTCSTHILYWLFINSERATAIFHGPLDSLVLLRFLHRADNGELNIANRFSIIAHPSYAGGPLR
jgi:hypothetical protein